MDKSIIIGEDVRANISHHATLAALGIKIREEKMLEPIDEKVHIDQKVIRYTPTQKLKSAMLCMLAGGHGMVEVNKRVRPDAALQAAFGLEGCAEQSVIQDTLDACTEENVAEMEQAIAQIIRRHSKSYGHDYEKEVLLIEIDLTGRTCGKKAKFATKGYFAKQRNRRGRQVGYLTASAYHEVLAEQVFDGNTHLTGAFQPLIGALENVLELKPEQRARIILRVDSGGGSVEQINWALDRGYEYHGKDYSGNRVNTLVAGVTEWINDPNEPGRQIGWVTEETHLYHRTVHRIAVRCRKKNGQWGNGVIVSTLSPQQVLALTGRAPHLIYDPKAVLLAYVYFYDQRGGGVEIEIKQDRQGLGTSKRNKRHFQGQQVVCLLEALAHNLLIWARDWLAPTCSRIAKWGLLRLVRDAFQMNGLILSHPETGIFKIVLNRADPFAKEMQVGFSALLAQEHVAICLGET